jgi:radical SAM protein with 4Fe4S-binding SPASM domain
MECPHILETNYRKFSDDIHSKVEAERIPIEGTIEISYRCNLNCVHCYCNLPTSDKTAAQQELTYREICDIIDQLVKEGCLWLLLTGGEPLIRKDFIDIYTYAKKKGLIITLFTNGTLVTPEIADYFKEWPPFVIEITLYGITKETYERITGIPGSFECCMKGIHLLLERKIPLKLKTMVMTLNQHELWDIKKYTEDLGIKFRFDPIIIPRLDGSKEPCSLRLSPEEIVSLDIADEERAKEWKMFCQKFWGPPKSRNLYICSTGMNSFHITPYGRLQGCGMVSTPSYNLREGLFREGWLGLSPKIKSRKIKSNHKCRRCEKISLCGYCPGVSKLEMGDEEIPIEYMCEIAHLRAKVFAQEINQNNER